MPSKTEVLSLVAAGLSYEMIAERLGILPGMAYLVATGVPADGSDVLSGEERRPGVLDGSTQHLANPPMVLPDHHASVQAWMRRRAADDAPMQAADAARTAVPPPVEGKGDTEDVLSVLGWDHNQVRFLQEQLEAIPGVKKGGSESQQRERRSIVDMITVRLSEHEVAEESHFWPSVRELLDDGDHLAEHAIEQEQEGKDLLAALGKLDGTEEEFDDLVERLIAALRKHVAFEDAVFLMLRQSTSEEQRSEIGRSILKAKRHAPTRPHPHAPDEGLPARMAAAGAAPLDKARDAIGHRPAERKGKKGHAPRKRQR